LLEPGAKSVGFERQMEGLDEVNDPLAVRLARRMVDGQIHILEAQVAKLQEITRQLEERERALDV
jgi:hypothetical protein